MDISLLKTFLEVAASGSFVAASQRLFVTQSAVSLRILRLEDDLGTQLFTRSKAGAELTPAGREFENYARSIIKIWAEARQQIALPEGFNRRFTIGAQYSLWPRLGFRWIDRLRAALPDLSIRGEMGMPDRLTRFMTEGVIHAGLMYSPNVRPGLSVEKLSDDELVLVASWPEPTMDLADRYLFVDWGPEFVQAHAIELPEITNPGLTLALGAMAAEFIANRNYAAYLPARYVKRHIERGLLHLVRGAPRFPFPLWVVWQQDLDPELLDVAKSTLLGVIGENESDTGAVLRDLNNISGLDEIAVLGQRPFSLK
jgi:DNA-binding transcriptional LysR family regulator